MGAEEFWAMALGSGYRIPLDVKGPDAAERVRSAFLDRIARERVTEVACDLMVARATKA